MKSILANDSHAANKTKVMTPKAIRVDSLAEREDPTTHLPNRIITDLGSPFIAIEFRS